MNWLKDIKKNLYSIRETIRKLPERKKKVILWTIIIVLAIIFFIIWLKIIINANKRFEAEKEKFFFPSLEKKLKEEPNLQFPRFSEEELNKLKEELKKLEK